jgi:hypothetical protein
MNEQLVGWFEDLLPEIKKGEAVDDVFLKFANEKNIAPALLEKLGHVYNTAKTVNYLDKSASHEKVRGDTFQILDVPVMLEKYADAKPSDDHSYECNDFSSLGSGRFTELKPEPKVKGVDFEALMQTPDYEEIKIASDRNAKLLKDSIKDTNVDQLRQLKFELSFDNEKYASELVSSARSVNEEFDLSQVEQDARYYMGDAVKQACDYVVERYEALGYNFDRKVGVGEKRFVGNDIVKFAKIQENLNMLEQIEEVKKNSVENENPQETEIDLFKQSSADTKRKGGKNSDGDEDDRGSPRARKGKSFGSTAKDTITALNKGELGDAASGATELGVKTPYRVGKSVLGGAKGALGISGNLPTALKGMHEDLIRKPLMYLGEGKHDKQKYIDSEMSATYYNTLIQDLLITDPILAEEDEDKVLSIYNTIIDVAPQLAKDKNVMRVALRSAVQHDGITPFDLQQFIETEKEMQKTRHNRALSGSIAYTPEERDRKVAS